MDATTTNAAADPTGPAAGLVWAFRFHPDGRAEPLGAGDPLDAHDGWVWLHLNLADARACQWLGAADLQPAARALLLSNDNYQQLHATDDCVYGVFADLVRDLDRPSEDIGFLRFAMTERLLVSARRHPLQSVAAARHAIESGGRRLHSVSGLLEAIVEHAAEGIDRITDTLAGDLDAIEESVLTVALSDERQKLGRVRRTTVRLHRQLLGLRTLFHRIEREGTGDLKPALCLAAGKLAQRLDGLDHEIVAMRERARLLQEEIAAKLAEETSRRLHALSIVTALFLPATLIAGLWGMNVKGIPFSDGESGFWWASAAAIASSIAVYFTIRRLSTLN